MKKNAAKDFVNSRIYLEFDYTQFCLNLLYLSMKANDKLTLLYRELFQTRNSYNPLDT